MGRLCGILDVPLPHDHRKGHAVYHYGEIVGLYMSRLHDLEVYHRIYYSVNKSADIM